MSMLSSDAKEEAKEIHMPKDAQRNAALEASRNTAQSAQK
jgi:hypothetical protein